MVKCKSWTNHLIQVISATELDDDEPIESDRGSFEAAQGISENFILEK